MSYVIGEHSAGPQAQGVSEAADKMADSVIKYYPTVTASKSDIVYVRVHGSRCMLTTVVLRGYHSQHQRRRRRP